MFLDFLDDVFLLHLAFEATQGVLQRFTFLDDDFGHVIFTPNPVRIGILRCHYERCTAPGDYRMLHASFACVGGQVDASSNQFEPRVSSNLSARRATRGGNGVGVGELGTNS